MEESIDKTDFITINRFLKINRTLKLSLLLFNYLKKIQIFFLIQPIAEYGMKIQTTEKDILLKFKD